MLYTALLPSLALLASTSLAAGGPHSGTVPRRGRHAEKARKLAGAIGKRESNARMTYYDTSVGAGACGIVHQNDEWTVALNGDQLRSFGTGYPPPACGKQITISYGGKTATATVQDECPSQYCSWGQLDLSPGLFNFFATPDTGVINADWWFGGAGDGGSTPAPADPTTTTQAPPAETTTAAAPPPAETTSAAAAPAETTSSAASVESSPAASIESSAAVSSAPAEATTAAAVTSSAAVEFAAAPAATTSSAAAASESERVAEDDESLPWCDELPEEEQDPVTTTAAPAATAAPIAAAAPAYTAPASGGGQSGGGGGGGEQAAPAQGTTVQAAAPASTAPAAAPAPVSGGAQTGSGGASTSEEGLEEGEEWCDEEPADEAPAPLVASAVCPDAGSIVLVQNNTILYNNTLAAFTNFTRGLIAHDNSSLATSTNYTLPTNGTSSFLPINGTQLIQNTTALCYNSTLFQVANVSSWTNFTSLLFGNATAGAETNATRLLGLDGPINGAGGKNATLGFMGFLETLSQRRR